MFRLLLAGCAALGSIRAEPLRVGYSIVPPLSFHAEGKPQGFTIDVLDEAARREGTTLVWVSGGASLAIEASLAKGSLDLVGAGMVTPERQARFYVSAPWWFAEL